MYLGYKYFETRYEDVILATANVGNYDYDSVVYRPFGFGLSYTDFAWSNYALTENADGTVTASVTVTNNGQAAGKDVVEIYFQSPYTDYDKANFVEKPSVALAGFAKTKLLNAGESETVSVTFDAQEIMKSYDYKNAKTYIMDEGDYYITAAKDAHRAVNNILAAKGYAADGDSAMVGTYTVASFRTLNTDAVTGTEITNRFDDAIALDTEYLSRQNWSRVEEGITYTADGVNIDNLALYYNRIGWAASGRPADLNNAAEFVTGAKNDLTIGDLTGVAYDDAQWDKLLDQMSVTEMHDLFKRAGYTTAAIESIGKARTYDFDGPAGIVNYVSGWSSFGYPSETILASTWNEELAEQMGRLVGEDGLRADIQGWYAASMNLHRTALSGRNFEYYSEEGLISGKMGAAEVRGARSKGMFVYIKHFAVNDQETNRASTTTWLTEQALRELYLKPFEISVKEGGATGVMGSMNRIGYRYTTVKQNPFGLVYDGAITENVSGQVNIHPVSYLVNGVQVAANLYTPAGYDEASEKKYPAVTVAHPNGGVKEQVSGLFAQKLAENGYIAIACDAVYQGASGGEPRNLDLPTNRVEDIRHVLEKVGFTLTHEDKNFKYYRIDRDMNIELKKMESDDEIRGKAYVHWKSWHEAYPGLVDQGYLDALTLEKCEKMAYSWPDNLIVAKDNGRVIGFVGYGDRGDEAPNTGEIFALYVLAEYYGKGVAQQLMKAGLQQITNYPQVCLWVLKENKRAIRFYEKCGFVPTGEELISSNIGAAEIRMVLKCER